MRKWCQNGRQWFPEPIRLQTVKKQRIAAVPAVPSLLYNPPPVGVLPLGQALQQINQRQADLHPKTKFQGVPSLVNRINQDGLHDRLHHQHPTMPAPIPLHQRRYDIPRCTAESYAPDYGQEEIPAGVGQFCSRG